MGSLLVGGPGLGIEPVGQQPGFLAAVDLLVDHPHCHPARIGPPLPSRDSSWTHSVVATPAFRTDIKVPVEGLDGCLPSEGFAGPVVERESDGFQLVETPSPPARRPGSGSPPGSPTSAMPGGCTACVASRARSTTNPTTGPASARSRLHKGDLHDSRGLTVTQVELVEPVGVVTIRDPCGTTGPVR